MPVNKKYYILTFGCQMNNRDSEIMAGLLEQEGYTQASAPEESDLVVLNTCSVRHSAENKVFGKLGDLQQLKQRHPELLIALGGCMAHVPESVQRVRPQTDIIFGTSSIKDLPRLVREAASREHKRPIIDVNTRPVVIGSELPSRRGSAVTAFVNIMYGCDNFCSYCIVPYTRGRERSRAVHDIIRELCELAEQGIKEVTLLGQNVNSYGRGLPEDIDFAELLHRAAAVDGLERIRFTTSHPRDVSERLIAALAQEPKVCEHIHVAMQAGSNKVLKRMNRRYTREYYLELIERMRAAVPGLAVSTDIIVGFPGETDTDFQDTLDMVEKIRFDSAFTFLFSPRSGTRAAAMQGQLPREVKQQRLLELNRVQYGIAAQKNKALEGKILQVLVEGTSKSDSAMLSGRSRSNHIVIFSGGKELTGRLINVRITEAKTFSIFGQAQL
ncbi:MAG: tRNA (N6-isopentenyl adenosine(37)-C2)-methylthiotransferase MiaB [Syntrophomonadaceae bacterium]|nr:tRNA (N6-isopentenyl adenosine(37)-C2)-methylthiotransferase MiaB [Syntrophomonadaceae bacterium]